MNRKLLLLGLALAVAAIVIVRMGKQTLPTLVPQGVEEATPAIRGKAAPDFELSALDGATVRGSDFRGKVVLVNFWATWCAPCLIEIPWFLEFRKQYGPQGFEVVGIAIDDPDVEKVKKFVSERKMDYPVGLGDEKIMDAFGGIIGLPTTFIVDREGKFYSLHRGLVSKEVYEKDLRQLLDQPVQQTRSLYPQSEPRLPCLSRV
ncbi:MAG: TlpA family protein disulfide reductase [Acidobacteria bacterium]|nr:TlpA family protein disulfide reductase [Acidobacteriota bacterium]